MGAIIVNGVGLLILVLLGLATYKYKKRYRSKLDKKEHPLLTTYGFSFWVIDKFIKNSKGMLEINDRKLKQLNIKEDIRKERYLYLAGKISICYMVLLGTLFIGTVLGVTEYRRGKEEVQSIVREDAGNGEVKYVLEVEKASGKETVEINADEKKLTPEDAREVIEEAKDGIIREMLGKNQDTDSIEKDLNFIDEYGEEGILISWISGNEEVIDNDGSIVREVEEVQSVDITAILQLEEETEEITITVQVMPGSGRRSVQEFLQELIDKEEYSKTIELPMKIYGEEVKYTQTDSRDSIVILIMGIGAVVLIFFLKDKELDNKLKVRKQQMLKDYPEIVSKLLLYNGAGISIRTSLEQIVKEYERSKKETRYAYEELQLAINKMKSGIREETALNEFGKRCGIHSYIKFANILQQNIKRGTKEISAVLEMEITEAFQERKNNALKEGEEAGTKLLGPMIIMLLISMAIIIVPAFMTMRLG